MAVERPFLDAHTLLHFGQTKVWVEDDRDAARYFCLLRFSFVASVAEGFRRHTLASNLGPSQNPAIIA